MLHDSGTVAIQASCFYPAELNSIHSYASNVLAGKPQKHSTFTSAGLRVLAAQELLAPLLARALFLGCTVLVC